MKTERSIEKLSVAFLVLASLAAGGCAVPIEETEAVSEASEAVTSDYFYDVAEYMAPSTTTPVNLTFPAPGETRRYVPTGVRHGGASWIYVKSSGGENFEEYTAGPGWIRLWTDTSWAWYNPNVNPPYCDETCGTQGVATACYREWMNDHPAAGFAYLAPRDPANTSAGSKFMPRYIPRNDNPYEFPWSGYLYAYKRDTCGACANNDSWHASAQSPVSGTAVARHVGSYGGWNDLIMKVTVSGSGKGDRFWYAKGYGFVGFEQINQNSQDMTSTDPAIAPVLYSSMANGSNGQGSAFPGANRACFGLAQGSIGGMYSNGVIPTGMWISIRANVNGKFVTAENAGNSPLIANRNAVGDWEKFYVHDMGSGNVALKAYINQRYVVAENAGASPLIANRQAVGVWEVFRWIDLGNKEFALQSAANGKFVSPASMGTQPLIANRGDVTPTDRLHWEPM